VDRSRNTDQVAVRSTQPILSAANGLNAEDSIETDRRCVSVLLSWLLSRQFQQPTTVRRQPPFIEVGHAEQQSLLPGRLHVPR
jgi:hypothetical protein